MDDISRNFHTQVSIPFTARFLWVNNANYPVMKSIKYIYTDSNAYPVQHKGPFTNGNHTH